MITKTRAHRTTPKNFFSHRRRSCSPENSAIARSTASAVPHTPNTTPMTMKDLLAFRTRGVSAGRRHLRSIVDGMIIASSDPDTAPIKSIYRTGVVTAAVAAAVAVATVATVTVTVMVAAAAAAAAATKWVDSHQHAKIRDR